MQTAVPPRRVVHMDEAGWWNFWNTSYRSKDSLDPISAELFTRVAKLISQLADERSCRVLEVACGAGALSRILSYGGYEGIDLSPEAIEIARQKAPKARSAHRQRPVYTVADVHDWAAPASAFDLVICIDAVVWFRNQHLALEKMAAALRPGGQLVLTAISPFVYRRIRRTAVSPVQEGPVSNWLSRPALHELVRSAGLEIQRSFTIMPRGNRGILRIINSPRLNGALGPGFAAALKYLKEKAGLGQYHVVVARKRS